ncbi:Protein of unknown function DUF2318, membrane [Denitrovibrio acetiphilus DSM 12809]|uniref:Membrane iron-sulfur containing protein FtrD-like domain-containing protein n=1 Tax=Denitrovibrio acetiphilus (strain DSM 12809 / NBRC 114555 / N2460) TaxID=522772 RepID=D4H1G8_DENA2|nr:DUF2318 domain-containing protein [Denitrovibrio acetiphilus]ADD68728.1 Protein of unknown function DUF2318, membrane [Denitrovibrio acetiphilus DSM 12809]
MRTVSKFIVLMLLLTFMSACGDAKGKYTMVTPENGKITIPVSSVNDGEAHYYSVESNGKEIKFFLLEASDGVIRAAFDACDVCYREKKGYSQNGEYMICNNCGQKFHSSRINVVKGGCNPSPLHRTAVGENIEINMTAIATGAMYF